MAICNEAMTYIVRGAPLTQTLPLVVQAFNTQYPGFSIAMLLFDAASQRLSIGAVQGLPQSYCEGMAALEVPTVDAVQFEQRFAELTVQHGHQIAESIPLRSIADAVLGLFVLYSAPGQLRVTDPGSTSIHQQQYARYRQTLNGTLALALLAIERAHMTMAAQTAAATEARESSQDQRVARMALAIEGSGTGIWDRNAVTGEIHYSQGWKAILGYEDWELSNRIEDSYTRLHPDDLPYVQATIREHFEKKSDSYVVEHRIRCKDQSYKWISSRGKVVSRDAQGNALRMVGTTTDITEMRVLSEQLSKSVELVTGLTNEIPGLVFQYTTRPDGSGYFSYVSEGVGDIYELSPQQLKDGPELIDALIHPEDMHAYQASLQALRDGEDCWKLEYRVLLPRQGLRWRKGHAQRHAIGDGGSLWHGFISDVTDSKLLELELQEIARTDFLTLLPNRRYFMTRLEEECNRLRHLANASTAVLMCDLDHFKLINDSHGHAVGDLVLKNFSEVLRGTLRLSDTGGRIGGEEFAMLLPDTDLEAARSFAARLQRRFADKPLSLGVEILPVTVSIGIAIMDAGHAGAEVVLAQSDAALYRAKQRGRNRIESLER
ncbi:diguanylate cyclase [Herbaspirillum lusitanum]|uniref:diguanylate cyclase n=1 Tax=Herbaspirillum lusitanum TaxID=213312 RepID=A0ABW9AEK4_9BURK